MRYSLLVALREYGENAKTKGFWIGILLFPLILVVMILAPSFLEEKATPTRYFSLVDQTEEFEGLVDRAVRRDHAKRLIGAFQKYVADNLKDSEKEATQQTAKQAVEAFERLPATGIEELVQQFLGQNVEMLDSFTEEGGLEKALALIRPRLRPDAPEFEEPRKIFVRVDLPDGIRSSEGAEDIAKQVRPYLLGDRDLPDVASELFAFVYIPDDLMRHLKRPGRVPPELVRASGGSTHRGIQYWSKNLTDTDLRSMVERTINEEVRRRLYEDEDIDISTVADVQRTSAILTPLNPAKEEGKEQVSMADTIRQWMPVGFVYLLFIALMTVVQMLLNNTVEEKSNRIIEVLLSSVTPGELMTGKLLGIAGVGLTMVTTWMLSMMLVLQFMADADTEIPRIALELLQSSGLLGYFAAYFVLGYLLYAGIFLALGSVCNTLKEAQNLMGPVVMLMIVPLITMMFVPKDPNGTLATALSWIPIYTPFLMMNRAAANPPMFDLVGTSVLLVISIVIVLWASGKIFRIAVLRTGQPPKILEVLRWLRG